MDMHVILVVTSHALKPTLLYPLFYSKQDHHLPREHHAALKKTWN